MVAQHPVGHLVPGTFLTPVSYATTPPTYQCACGNVVQMGTPRVRCGMGCTYKAQSTPAKLNVPIPGSCFTPVADGYFCRACGSTTQQAKWEVENLIVRHCGCKVRGEVKFPVGTVIPDSHLIPVDYKTQPPTYLCTACLSVCQKRRYHVDNLTVTHCGCMTRKRHYYQTTCPHCGHIRHSIGNVPQTLVCHECNQNYDPDPIQPSTCKQYNAYLRRRRK